MGTEKVTLIAGGFEFSAWEKVEVTAAVDEAVRSFAVETTERIGEFAFPPGTPVTLLASGALLVTGYVNQYDSSGDAKTHRVTIKGRGRGQDFLDCAATHPRGYAKDKTVAEFARDAHGLVHRQLLLPLQPGPETLAFDEGHDVEQVPVHLARIEERQQVGMLEVGGDLDFREEPLDPEHRPQLGIQDLEGDLAVVADVVREEYRGHAAPADFAVNRVSAFERAGQIGGHGNGNLSRAPSGRHARPAAKPLFIRAARPILRDAAPARIPHPTPDRPDAGRAGRHPAGLRGFPL